MDQKMFCYQCQETAGCKGCTVVGVCGKQPDVAAMQDLLVWVTKGISAVTTRLREEGRALPPFLWRWTEIKFNGRLVITQRFQTFADGIIDACAKATVWRHFITFNRRKLRTNVLFQLSR